MKRVEEFLIKNLNGEFPFNYLYLQSAKINVNKKFMMSYKSKKHQTTLCQTNSFYKPISLLY
jgi:hypothetical protein